MKKSMLAIALVLGMQGADAAKLCRKVIKDATYSVGSVTFSVNRENFSLTSPDSGESAQIFCDNNYNIVGWGDATPSTSLPKIAKNGESWIFAGGSAWGTTCYGSLSNLSFRYYWRDVGGAANGLFIDMY